jgi:two-component system response regulator RegA
MVPLAPGGVVDGRGGAQPAGRAILLVDHASEARNDLARAFDQLGYVVWGVEDPAAVLDVARASHPEVVVADPAVWRVGAARVVNLLRAALPGVAIAVLTACASIAHAVGALRSGAATYLAKPVTAQQILGSVYGAPPINEPYEGGGSPRTLTLDEAIWQYMSLVMEEAGSVSEAARRLGVDRRSLRRMMVKYAPQHQPAPRDPRART